MSSAALTGISSYVRVREDNPDGETEMTYDLSAIELLDITEDTDVVNGDELTSW